MKDKFWRRLRRIWRGYLAEIYATGGSLALVVALVAFIALRFDWNLLAEIATSPLDFKPVLLFLLGWCVVRSLQLLREELFTPRHRDGRFARRLRKAMADAAVIYFSACFGVAVALWVSGAEKHSPGVLVATLMVIVIGYPIGIASGLLNARGAGITPCVSRWLGLFIGFFFFGWMAISVYKEDQRKKAAEHCPPTQSTSVKSASS